MTSLKHTTNLRLPRIQAWFDSSSTIPEKGFQIAYQIHAASPGVERGALHASVTVERRPVDVAHGVNVRVEPQTESDDT